MISHFGNGQVGFGHLHAYNKQPYSRRPEIQTIGPFHIPPKGSGHLFTLACGCMYNNRISAIVHGMIKS